MPDPMPSEDVPAHLIEQMKPEGVPDDLVNLATMVALEHNPDGSREELTRFLADVLPAHEAMVRAKVAAELFGRATLSKRSAFRRGINAAANFVNPPTVEDAAKAVARGEDR